MIDRLQQHLSDIYQVGGVHDVRDFLITDPRLAQCIGAGSMMSDTSETLLLAEDEEGLALSLFLDGELLARLESADPLSRLHANQLDDLWKVFEGLSHFNCVVWKASRDRCCCWSMAPRACSMGSGSISRISFPMNCRCLRWALLLRIRRAS